MSSIIRRTISEHIASVLDRIRIGSPETYYLALGLSISARVEPALIRRLRIEVAPRIFGRQFPVSCEQELWFGPWIAGRDQYSITFGSEYSSELRRRLFEERVDSVGGWSPVDYARSVYNLLLDVHAKAHPVIQFEERLTFLSIETESTHQDIEHELRKTILPAIIAIQDPSQLELARWMRGLLHRIPRTLLDSQAIVTLGEACRQQIGSSVNTVLVRAQNRLSDSRERFVTIGLRRTSFGVQIGYFARGCENSIRVVEKTPLTLQVRMLDGERLARVLPFHSTHVNLLRDPNQSDRVLEPPSSETVVTIPDDGFVEITTRSSAIAISGSPDVVFVWKAEGSPNGTEVATTGNSRVLEADLTGKRLDKIPATLETRSLQRLSLRNNRISELDTRLAECLNLIEIDVSGNLLRELPDWLWKLPRLEIVRAQKNQIRTISNSIADAAKLKILELANNQLAVLPPQIGLLRCLSKVTLDGNPLDSLPETVRGQPSHIVPWMRKQSGYEFPETCFKVYVLGDSSDIVQSLIDSWATSNGRLSNGEARVTLQVEVSQYDEVNTAAANQNEGLRWQFVPWYLPNEIFSSCLDGHLMSGSAGVIICADNRGTIEHLLSIVTRRLSKAPALLVTSKPAPNWPKQFTSDLHRKFDNLKGIVSSRSPKGQLAKELQVFLRDAASQLQSTGDTVANSINQIAKSISLEQPATLCREPNGIYYRTYGATEAEFYEVTQALIRRGHAIPRSFLENDLTSGKTSDLIFSPHLLFHAIRDAFASFQHLASTGTLTDEEDLHTIIDELQIDFGLLERDKAAVRAVLTSLGLPKEWLQQYRKAIVNRGSNRPLIYICYRSSQTRSEAIVIERELKRRLGSDAVLLGTGGLHYGDDFEELLVDHLEKATVLLPLIGPGWAALLADGSESRRIDDPKDWVRRVIEYFLERDKTIIPILVDGRTTMPRSEDLPSSLAKFVKYQSWVIHMGQEKHDLGQLIHQLCDPQNNFGFTEVPSVAVSPGGQLPPGHSTPIIPAYLERLAAANAHLTLLGMGRSLQVELPIDEAYVSLSVHVKGGMEIERVGEKRAKILGESTESHETKTIDFDSVFTEARKRNQRGVVVLGEPGAGKTTVARKLAWRLASGETRPEELGLPAGITPVLLKFRNLKSADITGDGISIPKNGLRQFLIQETQAPSAADDLQNPGEALWNQQEPGLLWILDGLEEVADPKQRKLVSEWIQRAITERPKDWFLVTSRFAGYFRTDANLGAKFLNLHVQPLNQHQIENFVHKWYSAAYGNLHGISNEANEKANIQSTNLLAILEKPEYQTGQMREMCCNPLMLTILCIVFHEERKLPTKRAELYAHGVRVLLESWRRDLYAESGGARLEPYDPLAAQSVLSKLAWWLHQKSDRRTAPLAEMAKHATEALAVQGESSGLGRDGTQFLNRMRDEAGIIAMTGDGEGECGFLHLSFQEYLAAFYAAANGLSKELARNATANWWREVALLSLRQNEGFCKAFFQEVISQSLETVDPAFVDQCLNEALFVDSATFIKPLRSKRIKPEKQAAILRVIKNQSWPELVKVCGDLERSEDRSVRELAREILARKRSAVSSSAVDHSATDDRITVSESPSRWISPPSTPKPQETWVEQRSGVALVYIPPGEFLMGSNKGRNDEKPVHRVRFSRGFWIGKYPVTNVEYGNFLTANPTKVSSPNYWGDRRFNQSQQPVVGVSWLDAVAYCEWMGGRLPTEAEWEFACRAGTTTEFSFGDDESMLADYAWYSTNSKQQTQPVGTKKPNPWGLHDLHGNVWEWCSDRRSDYIQDDIAMEDPIFTNTNLPLIYRGGSFVDEPQFLRSSQRSGAIPGTPDFKSFNLGFRVCITSESPQRQ